MQKSDGKTRRFGVQSRISTFLVRYRITPPTTTGIASSTVMMLRYPGQRLDLLRPSSDDNVVNKQSDQRKYHDQRAKGGDFDAGIKYASGITVPLC